MYTHNNGNKLRNTTIVYYCLRVLEAGRQYNVECAALYTHQLMDYCNLKRDLLYMLCYTIYMCTVDLHCRHELGMITFSAELNRYYTCRRRILYNINRRLLD